MHSNLLVLIVWFLNPAERLTLWMIFLLALNINKNLDLTPVNVNEGHDLPPLDVNKRIDLSPLAWPGADGLKDGVSL